MNNKKKGTILNWEDFQSLGNPDNAPEIKKQEDDDFDLQVRVRIFKDRKKRKGKIATLIKGLEESGMDLKDLSKKLKTQCGVGGSVIDDESILLQGDQMHKAQKFLENLGFKDVKLSGI